MRTEPVMCQNGHDVWWEDDVAAMRDGLCGDCQEEE